MQREELEILSAEYRHAMKVGNRAGAKAISAKMRAIVRGILSRGVA